MDIIYEIMLCNKYIGSWYPIRVGRYIINIGIAVTYTIVFLHSSLVKKRQQKDVVITKFSF